MVKLRIEPRPPLFPLHWDETVHSIEPLKVPRVPPSGTTAGDMLVNPERPPAGVPVFKVTPVTEPTATVELNRNISLPPAGVSTKLLVPTVPVVRSTVTS